MTLNQYTGISNQYKRNGFNAFQVVGCDKMLNSGVKFDACMECGGDGSSCTTVSDAIDTHHLRNGIKFDQYRRLLDYLYHHVNFYPRRY